MNRYALWKYIVIAVALLFGVIYTVPNFFGEAPAVQVSSAKATVRVDPSTRERVETTLRTANVPFDSALFETVGLNSTVRVRLQDTDTQLKAKDAIEHGLNPDPKDPTYVVALNLVSRTPPWLMRVRALPMYLGLDLRGGVHFLMQVDMKEAVEKRAESIAGDLRTLLRDKSIRHGGINRAGNTLDIRFRDDETRKRAEEVIRDSNRDLVVKEQGEGTDLRLIASLSPPAIKNVQDSALKQNITTLHNRINELGVSEPVIQQQGADRVVVQLPGVQDTAKAKEILGRTATLEVRLLCEAPEELSALASGSVPFGCERYNERSGQPLLTKRQVILTGENLNDAQAGFD